MVRQDFQSNILLGYRHHSLLVHVRVVDTHPAEDGESLHEVLVVLRERQVVELVDELDDADDLPGGVFDSHAQDAFVLEADALVDAWVKPGVVFCAEDVDSLKF